MKSEEATEAGAAVVLLATAGGSPSPKPSLLGCQPQLLETAWQRVRQEQGTLQVLHAEKWLCAGEGAGNLQEGDEGTLQKIMHTPYHSGNI